eukprot:CAMPEP_0114477816 /NCGR_PEP_ID=MMETSP0104-20121206/15586_1 /TAXON_ID=37642 ORGANISM="Paraphysomonas imperforata, Strain PA2" /NCGR_SAMPLE_ID=MMETSP0104 /ASSEMBLY_ACC=CAM_ASM_000202 /LENGTH=121 /DNA_ID=CAMNT_0001652831 /DNA_START=75 /DNA_END=436 /DNA_ORIENTATION=+
MEALRTNSTCIVGYALNKKKMRKGGTDISSSSTAQPFSSSSDKARSSTSSTVKSVTTCMDNGQVNSDDNTPSLVPSPLPTTSKNSLSVTPPQVWKGGGLADLLNEKDDSNVRFLPIDFEKP